ncbi:uncharacterized protein G2W53_041509 [Senna tora]|uniref:Uncharacterized protein n=1 Tax=Senna tora TaxID=362788 RepID=A0A834SS59_9FABA|nr:uncharacterized protein G2W53_041460 [Senna tora]KAF7802398.1 uncharacterized protein G2W53_041509 [Senna tora]
MPNGTMSGLQIWGSHLMSGAGCTS